MSENLIILADRIKQISWTTGTSDFELSSTSSGFSSFDSIYSDGDILFYAATNGIKYEVGSGIFSISGSTQSIVRMPFRTSETNNAIVPFPDGAKEVYVTYPATHSVYIGSGVADFNFPQTSGIAFWSSTNILNYDSDIIWDLNNKRLGIKQAEPQHAIDIGGSSQSSSVQASGFYVGPSGVVFPSANNGDSSYVGGNQLIHFEPNELDSSSLIDQVIELSGVVDNVFIFKKQPQGTFLSGPGTDTCSGPCADEYPVFRAIEVSDIPDLSSLYVNFSDLSETSGNLSSQIGLTSGNLESLIDSVSTNLSTDIAEASGSLRSSIDDIYRTIDVTEDGEQYLFNNVGYDNAYNPDIRLYKGLKYTFNVNASGYPFFIKSEPTADAQNVYNFGVSNNGEDSGEIIFTVPQDAPDRLYYSTSSASTMSGVIYTSDLNLSEHNSYDYMSGSETEASDSIVVWDASDEIYKNISLENLITSPSGNSYIKYETVPSEGHAGDLGEISFDDNWVYFKTSNGWKRTRINPFVTTIPPITTTTIPPYCTTPEPCPDNGFRVITGTISDGGEYDGCPIYSDCQTTTTTTAAITTTTMAPYEPIYNSVFTWGYNGNSQLGYISSEEFSNMPTDISLRNISLMKSSDFHVLAITSRGKLYAWGWNSQGQIGNGTKVDATSPTVVAEHLNWSYVDAGDYHSAGITTEGHLYTWGGNSHGQLGNGTRLGNMIPTRIGSSSNWAKVFCGTSHTIAINSLGEMFAWGSNEYGQVGDGTFIDVLLPKKIGIGNFWSEVSAYMHTMALTSDGSLFAWGRNLEGQLGIATISSVQDSQGNVSQEVDLANQNVNTPTLVSKTTSTQVSVDSLTTNAGSSDNWKSISAGYKHSLAINQAGELYSCGTNSGGSLGLSESISSVPAFFKVSQERNWITVAAGNYHSFAINSADDLFATGRNNRGQLGTGNTDSLSSFTLISSEYNWELPVAGYDFTAAVGNVSIITTTTSTSTTTTTGEPEVFTNTLTLDSNGSGVDQNNGINVTGGQESDILSYNIPATLGSLPITCLIYSNNTFILAITTTDGYSGERFKINRQDQEYKFTLSSGRVDI